jgi:hypothetical protein
MMAVGQRMNDIERQMKQLMTVRIPAVRALVAQLEKDQASDRQALEAFENGTLQMGELDVDR